ncbi:MAG: heat shock protein HtpX [Candidatus Woesearchaeota archaeon]|nr:heat shock protein HtpX [Candidatus Woesearchaeota archaeon]
MKVRSMFEEKRRNIIVSYIVMALFFLLIIGLGTLLGFVLNNAWAGAIITGIISFIYFIIVTMVGNSAIMNLGRAKPADPQKHQELINIVEELSIAAGFKKAPKVYIIEDESLNAFATGTKPEKSAVAVTSGLLKKLNRTELEGVLSHEISHIKNRDSMVMLYAIMFSGIVVILSRILIRSFIFGSAGGSRDNKGAGTFILAIIGFALALLAPLFALLIRLAVSRQREYVADANGAILTRYPDGLADALEKIKNEDHSVKNIEPSISPLFIENPLGNKKQFLSNLFSTHPPIDERIRRLREM